MGHPPGGDKVSTTHIEAFHRGGQTFITWPEDTSISGEHYVVYRHDEPITDATIDEAERLAVVDEDSGLFRNEVESGNPYQTRYIIHDLGDELPEHVGLHVHTIETSTSGPHYYAVRVMIDGEERPLDASRTLGAGEGIAESPGSGLPVMVYTNGLKTLYTHWMNYHKWNTSYEGYAYNFWVGIPSGGNSSPLPLQMHLHAWGESWQRYWTSGDAYQSGTPYDFQAVWVEPDDHRNTWWYGFGDNVERGETPHRDTTIVNYTEQRLDWIFDWILGPDSPYLIDPERIYLYGGSMGGAGALSYGLHRPDRFAAVYALIGMTNEAESNWGRGGFDALWGTLEDNLPTNEGIPIHDRMNIPAWLDTYDGDDLPYVVTMHGREDTTIEWSTQGRPWIQARRDGSVLGPVVWADSDHSNSFDIYTKGLFANYSMDLYALHKNEPYVLFFRSDADDDPDDVIPSCRGEAPYAYGFDGNAAQWASAANPFSGYAGIMETNTSLEVALRLRDDYCDLPDRAVFDVVIGRRQSFLPEPGGIVEYVLTSIEGTPLQTGTTTIDEHGRLRLNGIELTHEGAVLTLTSSEAPQPDDNDGDGYPSDEGDCDDSDPSIHPEAEERCDQKDNDCDGVIDEGLGLRCRLSGLNR